MTNDGTWTYTYDDEGNRATKSKGASLERWTYTFDQWNQLTKAEKRDGADETVEVRVEYKFHVFGQRIERTLDPDGDTGAAATTTTRYAYDDWGDLWADLNTSNQLQVRYLRGDVVDQLFARISSGTAAWYLTDRLGSVRNIADASGALVATLTYDAFGQLTSAEDSDADRFQYTGLEWDKDVKLQHSRAREYDPATARFLQEDPIGFGAGDTNLTRYVGNSPTNFTDPSGLEALGAVGIGGPCPTENGVPIPEDVQRARDRLKHLEDEVDRLEGLLPNADPSLLPGLNRTLEQLREERDRLRNTVWKVIIVNEEGRNPIAAFFTSPYFSGALKIVVGLEGLVAATVIGVTGGPGGVLAAYGLGFWALDQITSGAEEIAEGEHKNSLGKQRIEDELGDGFWGRFLGSLYDSVPGILGPYGAAKGLGGARAPKAVPETPAPRPSMGRWAEEAIPERDPNFHLPPGPHGTGVDPPSGVTPGPGGPITPGPGAPTIGGSGDITPSPRK